MEELDEVICDTECFPNFWSIGFYRLKDGKTLVFEHSVRKPITEKERERIRAILYQNRIITYNGNGYDYPMIWLMLGGADNAKLKRGNDRIIEGGMKPWDAHRSWEDGGFGISMPKPWEIDHIDLIEPQPNAWASLKTLQGRLHGKSMQDLPYQPDTVLTHEQMDHVLSYMGNDCIATENVLEALRDALAMRVSIGGDYKKDYRSKSDAQMGEAMIKSRVEKAKGDRVTKIDTPGGTTFEYKIPEWLDFQNPKLQSIADKLRNSEFMVLPNGKVKSPEWLEKCPIQIGETEYSMGIGGLHSTEKNRAVHSDEDYVLLDFDVASYYPAIILNSGLYPRSLGPAFIDVYREIRDERVLAKRAGDKTKDKGLKIALNGAFGKLGSAYSVLYAPHLMIAITLGGQLALLMLIDRCEAAGIQVVSGNTDGVVLRVPREMVGPIVKDRVQSGELADLINRWEADTGFELEATEYLSLYNASVNSYFAFKPDGKAKVKGAGWTGRHEGDIRTQLMKNPQFEIVSLAVIEFIARGTPLEDTIRACTDIRDFVRVVNVAGGGTWRGQYLGKVVRYYLGLDGEEILYSKPHETTGNYKKVSKSEGARPCMNLPDELPDDIDYDAYVAAAKELLMDIGFDRRPDPVRPLRIYKWSAMAWFAIAV